MPASETRGRVNQADSPKPVGLKTNHEAIKSGGHARPLEMDATVAVPEAQAAEVERRVVAFEAELNPSGAVGRALARLAATMAVRMECCAEQECAALAERVRQAEAAFVPPEGVDDETAARLRSEAGKRALFDPSPEAGRARQFEASAVRVFFRSLKELRQVEKAAKQAAPEAEPTKESAPEAEPVEESAPEAEPVSEAEPEQVEAEAEPEIEQRADRQALASFSSQAQAAAPPPILLPSGHLLGANTDGPSDLSAARCRYDMPNAIAQYY